MYSMKSKGPKHEPCGIQCCFCWKWIRQNNRIIIKFDFLQEHGQVSHALAKQRGLKTEPCGTPTIVHLYILVEVLTFVDIRNSTFNNSFMNFHCKC